MKFRVYDKINNRYVTDEQVWSINCDGNLFYIDIGDSHSLRLTTVSNPDYTVEYFTECHDKCRKHIYMNDVILLSNGSMGVVRYGRFFDWTSNVLIEGWYIHAKCEDGHEMDLQLNSAYSSIYFVVGNTHNIEASEDN